MAKPPQPCLGFPPATQRGRAADKGKANYVSQFRHSPTSHGPETAGVAVAGCRAHGNLCDKRSCLAPSSVGHLVDIASVVPATLLPSDRCVEGTKLEVRPQFVGGRRVRW